MVLSATFLEAPYADHLHSCIRFLSHMFAQLSILVVYIVWNTGYLGELRMLESVQRRWTKKVEGFADLPYSERLSRLKLFSIKGRLLRADLIQVWKILSGLSPQLNGIFSRADFSRKRGHNLKICVPHHSTDVRGRFFSLRVISTWNSLPEIVVSAQSIQSFKYLLEQFLGHRLYEYC